MFVGMSFIEICLSHPRTNWRNLSKRATTKVQRAIFAVSMVKIHERTRGLIGYNAVGSRETACRLFPVQITAKMVKDDEDDDDDNDDDDDDDDDADDDAMHLRRHAVTLRRKRASRDLSPASQPNHAGSTAAGPHEGTH